MQGIFLDELEQFAVRELGQTGLSRIRKLTGRREGGYVFDASYPDAELPLIVQSIAEAAGRPPDEIMEQFAEAMVPGLLEVYGFMVDPSWTFVDFLLNTEAVIHKGDSAGRAIGEAAGHPGRASRRQFGRHHLPISASPVLCGQGHTARRGRAVPRPGGDP